MQAAAASWPPPIPSQDDPQTGVRRHGLHARSSRSIGTTTRWSSFGTPRSPFPRDGREAARIDFAEGRPARSIFFPTAAGGWKLSFCHHGVGRCGLGYRRPAVPHARHTLGYRQDGPLADSESGTPLALPIRAASPPRAQLHRLRAAISARHARRTTSRSSLNACSARGVFTFARRFRGRIGPRWTTAACWCRCSSASCSEGAKRLRRRARSSMRATRRVHRQRAAAGPAHRPSRNAARYPLPGRRLFGTASRLAAVNRPADEDDLDRIAPAEARQLFAPLKYVQLFAGARCGLAIAARGDHGARFFLPCSFSSWAKAFLFPACPRCPRLLCASAATPLQAARTSSPLGRRVRPMISHWSFSASPPVALAGRSRAGSRASGWRSCNGSAVAAADGLQAIEGTARARRQPGLPGAFQTGDRPGNPARRAAEGRDPARCLRQHGHPRCPLAGRHCCANARGMDGGQRHSRPLAAALREGPARR